GWRATFDTDAQQFDVAVDGVKASRTYPIPASLVLPDRLSEPLAPLWRGKETALDFPYLMPAAARPVMARAERVSKLQPSEALVPIRITTAGSDHSATETLWVDANGEVRKRQQQLYGTPL